MRRHSTRGFVRDSLILGAFWSFGSTSVLAQVAGQLPGGDMAGLITSTGIQGLLVFFLVQSMKREVQQAQVYAADLKQLAAKQAEQSEKLLTAVIERLPSAKDPLEEKGKK
jgi:Zn-dependent protease with chaperone function